PRNWDDVKLLDGCPGKYVVIARRSAGKWYVGAINSQSQAQKVRINLKSLGLKKATVITDGENNRSFVQKSVDKNVVEIDIQAGGGCVIF
ncbi:MAG: glycoside hydrolase family 97 C-terminal domain-containing protein, partial [Paludibacter sp.]